MREIVEQWFAVRCCCTPQKIFGFLQLNVELLHGNLQDICIRDQYGEQHTIELKSLSLGDSLCSVPLSVGESFIAEFRVPEHQGPMRNTELAIYSDDRPIEFWRTIPNFIEAVPQKED